MIQTALRHVKDRKLSIWAKNRKSSPCQWCIVSRQFELFYGAAHGNAPN